MTVFGEIATGTNKFGDRGGKVIFAIVHRGLLPVRGDWHSVPDAGGESVAHRFLTVLRGCTVFFFTRWESGECLRLALGSLLQLLKEILGLLSLCSLKLDGFLGGNDLLFHGLLVQDDIFRIPSAGLHLFKL